MFQERLSELADRIRGTEALSLVARDGIPVESVTRSDAVDVEVLAAELLAQLRSVSDNQMELGVGVVSQLALTTERFSLVVSAVSDEYYLLLVLGTDGSIGRARYEMRRARTRFEPDLL